MPLTQTFLRDTEANRTSSKQELFLSVCVYFLKPSGRLQLIDFSRMRRFSKWRQGCQLYCLIAAKNTQRPHAYHVNDVIASRRENCLKRESQIILPKTEQSIKMSLLALH